MNAPLTVQSFTPRKRIIQRFMQHRLALISFITLLILCTLALFAPVIEHLMDLDNTAVDLFNRLQPSSATHWLGTDELGRDLFIRLLYGGRISLGIGLISALLAAVIGTLIGLCAGYFGGWLDSFLMRFTDGIIALPLLPLLIVLAAIDLNKLGLPESIIQSDQLSLYRIVLIISLVGWTTVARLVRAETLSIKSRDFVLAARAQGATSRHILLVHILPNVMSPIVVATTLTIGNVILFESVLSFLALGVQPPFPSWGNMLTNVQDNIWDAPILAFWPGAFIFLTVMAFNFLGDGFQDTLDPRASIENS